MTDLEQPQTTSYGSKGNVGRYSLCTPPPAEHVCYNQEQVGKQYGWVKILSAERRYTKGWSRAYVAVECVGCGHTGWTYLSNLTRGISKGCQACSKPKQVPMWLDRRLTAAKQRCENPDDPGYKNYGARGVEFRFPSVTAAGLYVMEHMGLMREFELDRIDNNGHYAPGNLRWATRSMQCRNARRSKLTAEDELWARTQSPYSRFTTSRLMRQGLTRQEVIASAWEAVEMGRKNWFGILTRLEELGYTTSSTPALEVDLQSLESLSTTAATEAAAAHSRPWAKCTA